MITLQQPPARIFLNLLLFGSILFLPWWCALAVALMLLVLFEAWEAMLWGLFFDLLYVGSVPTYFNSEFLFTLILVVLFFTIGFLKQKLIFY